MPRQDAPDPSKQTSILPSLVLHTGGDALDALLAVTGSGSNLDAPQSSEASAHAGLWLNLVVLTATGVAAISAYRALAELVKDQPSLNATRPVR